MAKANSLPFRQIHLDFHTGPWINDVGAGFSAREFARVMKQARVNSVTIFAKCHHGHLYYDTQRAERHPGLKKGLDLTGEQVEALHREGIRAPIYISVQCDEFAADTHPEWIVLGADGKPASPGPLGAGWQILDMSSPYQEYLAEQTREVLKAFKPVDGIFFDMCWDQPSLSNYAVEAMLREGFNPEIELDRQKYAHKVAMTYMKRFYKMVKETAPDATVAFNSRPLGNLKEELPFLAQVEIEALPTGGWGYMYFPKNVRFARTFDRQYLGMTARFHKTWSDFGGLKPYAALEYETSQMIAHGARCSIGDQLHPRGFLDPAAYDLIGKVYARVEAREPWLVDAKPVSQIGLFQIPSNAYFNTGGSDEGATRMLTQLRQQFDVVTNDSRLENYEMLILPDLVALDDTMIKRIRAFVKNGGALLVSGKSGLNAAGTETAFPELGLSYDGASPFGVTYFRFMKGFDADAPNTDHVQYDTGLRVTAGAKTEVVAKVVEPYFERGWRHFCGHNQTPAAKSTKYAAATINGRVGYIAYPIFQSFANHGNYPLRLLVRNMLDRLLPEPVLRVDGPTYLEGTVMRQGKNQGNRTVVHLLAYAPERRAKDLDIVEDIVPLYNVPLSLKLPKSPKKVYLAPTLEPVEFEYLAGRVNLRVPEVRGHAMIVFE